MDNLVGKMEVGMDNLVGKMEVGMDNLVLALKIITAAISMIQEGVAAIEAVNAEIEAARKEGRDIDPQALQLSETLREKAFDTFIGSPTTED